MICYDITDDRKRLRAANTLMRYGERVQRSVYECHLSRREAEAVMRELEAIIDRTADRVRFYPLCERDRAAIVVEGGPALTADERFRLA